MSIEEMVKELPEELKSEVQEFIQKLLRKKSQKSKGKPSFKWAGALKDMKYQYTSVELQHKISEWRSGEK